MEVAAAQISLAMGGDRFICNWALDSGTDPEANQTWKRVKTYSVPVTRYEGKSTFGTENSAWSSRRGTRG